MRLDFYVSQLAFLLLLLLLIQKEHRSLLKRLKETKAQQKKDVIFPNFTWTTVTVK